MGMGPSRRRRRFRFARRPPRRRIRWWLVLGAFALLGLGALLGDAYFQCFQVYQDLQGVVPQLTQAREDLAKGEIPGAPIARASETVAAARQHVERARFTFRVAGRLPFLGRPVKAVRLASSAASEEVAAATVLQQVVGKALGPTGANGRKPAPIFHDGTANVALIERLTPLLESAVGHLRVADRDIRAIPSLPFVHRLDRLKSDAVRESSKALALAEDVLSGTKLMPAFLGAGGTRTYFLAMQNNADQRATGGDLLAYAFVRASRGKLSLEEGGPIGFIDHPRYGFPQVRLPPSLQWFVDSGVRPRPKPRIANINLSPDFPVVARTWTDLVAAATGRRVDGVIAIDPFAVSAAMGGKTISVPSYPRPITARNLVEVVENGQYRLPLAAQFVFPAQLIGQAWELLRDPTPLVGTLQKMGEALREKHVQIWSARPQEQALIAGLGWDGGLRVPPGDYLYLTDNKLLANKVDYYSQISMRYDVTLLASGAARSTCQITFENATPPGQPHAISFGRNGGSYALNQALLGLYVPRKARLESSQPPEGPSDHIERGAKVFLRTVGVAGGKTKLVVFVYTTPGVVTSTGGGKRYRLTVQHQPMTNPVHLTVTVQLPPGSTVKLAPGWRVQGTTAILQVDLTQDLVREIDF